MAELKTNTIKPLPHHHMALHDWFDTFFGLITYNYCVHGIEIIGFHNVVFKKWFLV
jgi:hypothetical protein